MLAGYTIKEEIFSNLDTQVFRAVSQNRSESVVIKIKRNSISDDPVKNSILNEASVYRHIDSRHCPHLIALHEEEDFYALVLDDLGGISLDNLIEHELLDFQSKLTIALEVTKSLEHVHRQGFIHKDINPSNIIYTRDCKKAQLIDFGLSEEVVSNNLDEDPGEKALLGTVRYISPEQTGRVQSQLDKRSDLYSLGATLYELFLGKPPFETKSELEAIHAHLALSPKPLDKANDQIPTVVSRIVLKLLNKSPDHRYQSASGLGSDLAKCLQRLDENGRIPDFPIGESDISEFWRFPTTLYGREDEIMRLVNAYQSIYLRPEIILLSGYSGSGKTAICNAFLDHVQSEGGIVASGKFEQIQGEEPFVALKAITKKLLARILRSNNEELKKWKAKMAFIAGKNAKVFIDFVPEFSLLFDEYDELAELRIEESTNRFNYLLCEFLKLFTKGGNQLALFLDDVHWMDPASIRFLRALFSSSDLRNLIVVGAFRSDEAFDSRTLSQGIQVFRDRGIHLEQIKISGLNANSIHAMLRDAFYFNAEEQKYIADLLVSRTEGNPFFIRELITNFCTGNLIYYDERRKRWSLNKAEIANTPVSGNVAELVKRRICQLEETTINALEVASCLGGEFRIDTLARTLEKPVKSLETDLSVAIKNQFLIQIEDEGSISSFPGKNPNAYTKKLKFSHDQIQSAFYSELDDHFKKETHLKIGRLYLLEPELRQVHAHVYEVCDQIDKAKELIHEEKEIYTASKLNLEAAIDAKNGGARNAAAKYIENGFDLIEKVKESEKKPLEYQICNEAANIFQGLGKFEEAEQYTDRALQCAETVHDQAVVKNLSVVRYTMEGAYQEAVDLGVSVLDSLGVDIPESESELKEKIAFPPEFDLQSEDTSRFIKSLPIMENDDLKIAMKIMVNLFPATHFVNQQLNGWLAVKMASLTMEHGFVPESVKGIVNYGALLALRGDFKGGYQFGRIALDLIQHFNLPELKPRVYYAFLGDLMHWRQPLTDARELTDEAYLASIEYGETAYGGYVLSFARCMNEVFSGEDLYDFAQKVREAIEVSRSSKNLHAESVAQAASMGISHLLGETGDIHQFDTEEFHENDFVRECESREDFAAIALFRLLQAQNFYFLSEKSEAESAIRSAIRYEKYLGTGMPVAMVRFFNTMIMLERASAAKSEAAKCRITSSLDGTLEQFEKWASLCPENFAHLHLLMRGLWAEVDGNHLGAISDLSKAVYHSEREKYNQFSALGHELLAGIWKNLNNDSYYKSHITKAYEAYFEWNAKIKLKKMRSEHRFLAKPAVSNGRTSRQDHPDTTKQSSSSRQEELDLAAIAAVTHSISEEINFSELLKKLAKLITEVSGADKYVLFLISGKTNQLEARSYVQQVGEDQSQSIEERVQNASYPKTLIDYISRSQETLRVSLSDTNFHSEDPYFNDNNPKSILCVPIVMQGRLLGVVYLENNELENIFSDERMQTINIICTQAGISIHNAMLFSSLEEQIEEKTIAYTELNANLEQRVKEQISEIETLNRFQRFVSPPVARLLMTEEGKEKLKSHRKEIGILFCDLRGFTAYSETVEPEEAMGLLNRYHAIVGNLVNEFEATIDHRAGDGLMIFLNDPFDIPNPIRQVVGLAIKLREQVTKLLEKYKQRGDDIGFGIGVGFGFSTIGMVGYEGRFDYAASGRYVNLTSRLCDEAKDGQILMPQKLAMSDQMYLEPKKIGDIDVKGFSHKVGVFYL